MWAGAPMGTVLAVQVPSRAQHLWARLRGAPQGLVDPVLAAGFVVAAVLTTASATAEGADVAPYEPRNALAVALILLSTAPYAVRRRAPLPVYLLATAALTVLSAAGYAEGILPLVAVVGAYTVGAHRPVHEAVVAGLATGVFLCVLYLSESRGFGASALGLNAALFGSAILLGRNVQSRRLRLRALEVGHEEAARRAASDERLRIAQELHDVVAHSLGVIAVQAGVGSHVLDTEPEEARRALDTIARTSRTSLSEIRRLLSDVRDRDGAPGYVPAPDLGDLPRLVDDVRHAGLRVELDLDGEAARLPGGVGLAAYRIVQESLTNTLRHADADVATVHVAVIGGSVTIEVLDDGRATVGGDRDGHGLIGMRERAALYGGSLETGPRPRGGYRVAAVLPFEPEPVP